MAQTLAAMASRHEARAAWSQVGGADAPTALRFDAWRRDVDALRGRLRTAGIGPGDVVAVVTDDALEGWTVEVAALDRGATVMPLSCQHAASRWAERLEAGPVTAIVVRDPAHAAPVLEALREAPPAARPSAVWLLHEVSRDVSAWVLDGPAVVNHVDALPTVDGVTSATLPAARGDDDGRTEAADLPILLETRRSDGRTRRVGVTNGAFDAAVRGLGEALPLGPDDRVACLLPRTHATGRALVWSALGAGATVLLPRSSRHAREDLAAAAPTVWLCAPATLEQTWGLFVRSVEERSALERRVFRLTDVACRNASVMLERGEPLGRVRETWWQLAQRSAYAPLRQLLGGQTRLLIVGGSPLSPQLARGFEAAGLAVRETWGLTEMAGAVTCNRLARWRVGTAGQPLAGVEVRVDDNDVLQVRGTTRAIATRQPRADGAAESVDAVASGPDDAEGWLSTGDYGSVDAEGFVRVLGRRDSLIRRRDGRLVAPEALEATLRLEPLIAEALVHGDGHPFLVALFTLDEVLASAWAKDRGIAFGSLEELSQHPAVFRRIQDAVHRTNREVGRHETIEKFAILERRFSVVDGEATATGRVLRDRVVRAHRGLLDSCYSDHY